MQGTILETTSPYSAQQNGIAERVNCTLTKHAGAMLFESKAPKFLWSEALAYACYLKNRVPSQVHGKFWPTPFEAFWGKKPDISTLQVWGSKCYVLNQGENRSKRDPKMNTAIFTGISDVQGKSWRYYKQGAKKILHSRNIAFVKSESYASGDIEDYDLLKAVVPPAEGEQKSESDSKSEQPKVNERTQGDNSKQIPAHMKSTPIKDEKPAHSSSPAQPSSLLPVKLASA